MTAHAVSAALVIEDVASPRGVAIVIHGEVAILADLPGRVGAGGAVATAAS